MSAWLWVANVKHGRVCPKPAPLARCVSHSVGHCFQRNMEPRNYVGRAPALLRAREHFELQRRKALGSGSLTCVIERFCAGRKLEVVADFFEQHNASFSGITSGEIFCQH